MFSNDELTIFAVYNLPLLGRYFHFIFFTYVASQRRKVVSTRLSATFTNLVGEFPERSTT